MFKGIPNDTLFVLRVRTPIDSRHFFGMMLAGIILFTVLQTWPRLDANLAVDEPYTANLVHLPLSTMWAEFQQVGYEITYHLVLKAWVLLFGDGETALRSLSLLFYSLSVVTVGLVARHIGGMRVGLCAAYLMAVSSPLGITHAANARPYALLAMQVSLALLIYFRTVQSPSVYSLLPILLICLHVLGLMNHPIYLFFMVGCVFTAWVIARRVFTLMAMCSVVALIVYLLLWWPALQTSLVLPRTTWMNSPTFADLIDGIHNLWGMPGLLLLGASLTGAILLRGKLLIALGILLVTMIGSLFFVSQFNPIFNPERTPILFLPVASVLVALLITRLKWHLLTSVILAVVGLNSILVLAHDLTKVDSLPTPDSVASVLDTAHCGDTFILGALSFSAVEYELRRLDAPDCIRRESFPLSTQSHPGWMDLAGLSAHRATLQDEARATVERLAAQAGRTIWVFYIRTPGDYHNLADILKWELDRRFNRVETLELRGLYFDSILVYSNEVTKP